MSASGRGSIHLWVGYSVAECDRGPTAEKVDDTGPEYGEHIVGPYRRLWST